MRSTEEGAVGPAVCLGFSLKSSHLLSCLPSNKGTTGERRPLVDHFMTWQKLPISSRCIGKVPAVRQRELFRPTLYDGTPHRVLTRCSRSAGTDRRTSDVTDVSVGCRQAQVKQFCHTAHGEDDRPFQNNGHMTPSLRYHHSDI